MIIDHWDVEELKDRIARNVLLQYNYRLQSNCWIWQGPDSGKGQGTGRGYGRMSYRNKTSAVHRIAFVLWNGPLRGKQQVDHICTNRLCCNPNHLQVVTHKQNCKLRDKRAKNISTIENLTAC